MEKTMIEIEQISAVLKLLGDKTRMTIIAILKLRECCVCELLEVFDMSQSSISQHLRKLKDAGFVKETKKGQWVYYSLHQQNPVFELIDQILEFAPEQTDKIKQIEKSNPTVRCGC